MKKTWIRKSVAVLMAMTMLFSMTGCNKKESKKSETEKQDTKEMVYQVSDFEIEGLQGQVNNVFFQDDRIYINTYEWIEEESSGEESGEEESTAEEAIGEEESATEESTSEEESATEEATGEEKSATEESTGEEESATEEVTGEEESVVEETTGEEEIDEEEVKGTDIQRWYSANIDGSDLKEITMPEMEENEWVQSFIMGKDGSMLILTNAYELKAEKVTFFLTKVDAQGNVLAKEDISKALKLSQESYINNILADDKGRVVVAVDNKVYILAEDFKSSEEIKVESYIDGMTMTKDGKIICGTSIYENDKSSTQVQVLDVDNKKWGETYKLDLQYFSSSDSLMRGVEYDFYYKDDSGIYGYDLASGKSTKLLDYVASDIISENSWGIIPIAKDTFLGTIYNEEGSKLVKYNKVDAATLADKTVITFGAMWVDDSIKKQAIEFNKNSKEYRIEFKDYSNEEDPVTKMNADIVAGNIPDIMSLSMMPYEQYISKGLLEDLTPYFEKDEELNTDDILDSVYEAMQVDGKLYYIAPSFGISTIVARTSDVGDGTGWTFDEMKAVLEEKGDSARPFYSENKSDILYSFLGNGLNDFVDWQTGACSFDSQDFKDILELCNKGINEEVEYNEDAPSMPTLIKDKKVLFVEGWVSPEEVQVYKKMFDGDITYIGYPNKEKSGSYFQFDNQIAIYAKSEVKEGAWEFIRSFMTKEYQGNAMHMYNTPTRKDCFDMMVKAKMATKEYTDELGQEVYPMQSSWGWDDLQVEITPLTQEEMDMYIDLVNNTKKIASNDDAMMEIIQEESKAYFAGEKSLDETVGIIQNRIKTYVNENR